MIRHAPIQGIHTLFVFIHDLLEGVWKRKLCLACVVFCWRVRYADDNQYTQVQLHCIVVLCLHGCDKSLFTWHANASLIEHFD